MKNEAARALADISWKKRKRTEGDQWIKNLAKAGKKGGQSCVAARGVEFYRDMAKKSIAARKKRKESLVLRDT